MTVAVAPSRTVARDLAITGGALALGLAALTLFLAVAGYDVGAALAALWDGAVGSRYAIVSATLVRAVPLVVLGLAFSLGARAGALNIGMEGQFLLGAVGATMAGLAVGGLPALLALPIVLAAGLAGGVLWTLIPLALRVRVGVTEVITTLLLNFVAEAVVSWSVAGPLQEATGVYPQSDPIAMTARLPRLVADGRVHLGLVLAVLLAVVLWVVFTRTAWGFRLRATGEGPTAAAVIGRVRTERVLAMALLGSGALAGLGGALEVSGVSYALYPNLSPGYGFTAIAVALLGRLHPLGVLAAGLMLGALEAGAGAMQRDAGIPAVAVQVVEAVVILVLVVAGRRR